MTGSAPRGLHRVDAIIASAGTGKTYTLVERTREALEGGLAPDRLLATTFTRKAAAELAGRIRADLIERGRWDPRRLHARRARRHGERAYAARSSPEFAFELGRSRPWPT